MRRSITIRRLSSAALGAALLSVLWLLFAPTSIGGSANWVTTDGVSMQPRFHSGDLAIVRTTPSYHVGEVVAYRSAMLHTIVLHRIIGRDGDRYLFKGDNNGFVDPEHPTRGQLIGRLWLHVPRAGVPLAKLRAPGLVALLIGLGVLGSVGVRKRRRRAA